MQKIHLTQFQAGEGHPVVCISGFLKQDNGNKEWESQLELLCPGQPCHYLEWESENLQKLGKALIRLSRFLPMLPFRFWRWQFLLAGYGVYSLSELTYRWFRAFENAQVAGEQLAKLILSNPQFSGSNKPVLFCHSLGAQVIVSCLNNWHEQGIIEPPIHSLHLLGGAADNDSKKWLKYSELCQQGIYNYYSDRDMVLSTIYKAVTQFNSNPIGRHQINDVLSVVNVDVSEHVKGHSHYINSLMNYCQYPVSITQFGLNKL